MSDYIVDVIFPSQEVHLIGGPSGGGKSTWLLQFIESWRQGQPILGYKSNPEPFVYISADRSERSVRRTFERIKLKFEDFPTETAASVNTHDLFALLNMVQQRHPTATVYFVEGFQSFTPGAKMNDYGEVSKFLTKLVNYCTNKKITVFGVCHATKTKKDEGYENPRQRLNGSVAWAAYSDTIIFVEPTSPGDPTDQSRRVMILPRNAAERTYTMEFKDGRLTEKAKPLTAWQRLSAWIEDIPVGQDYHVETIQVATVMGRSTLTAELSKAVSLNLLKQVKNGIYRKLDAKVSSDA